MEHEEQMKRWRLILGEDSEKRFSDMNGGNPLSLTEEQALMDNALAAIYNRADQEDLETGAAGELAAAPPTPKLPAGWGMSEPSLTKTL